MNRQRKCMFNTMACLLIGLLGVFTSSFQSTADRMASQFGQPVTMVGTYISVFAAGSFFSVFFSGSLADRIGKKKVVVGSVILIVIGSMILASSHWSVVTLLGLLIMGMGFGTTEAMGSAMLTDENPDHPGRWMNISQILFCAGAILAPIASVWYCTTAQGSYQNLFFMAAIAFSLLLIYFLFSKHGGVLQNSNIGKKSIHPLGVLKNSEFRLYALMIFLYLGYESIGPVYIKALLIRTGSTEVVSAAGFSLFWLSMIVGRFVGVLMSGKEKQGIRFFPLFVVVAVFVLLFGKSPEMRLFGTALYGFGCGPLWPMLCVLAAKVFPDRSGSAYAVMMMFSSAGYMIFPFFMGSLVNNLIFTLMGCGILSVIVFILSFLPKMFERPV